MVRAARLGSIGIGVLAALMTLGGCGAPEGRAGAGSDAGRAHAVARPREAAHVGGDVVATLDGVPITIAEVEAAAREAGLEPALALRRLEEEQVLGALAARASLGEDAEARAAARRAAVRALLRERIEAPNTPEGISSADVEARRVEIQDRLQVPETRRATHLLVPLAPDADPAQLDAATRLANELRAAIVASADPSLRADELGGRRGAFDVRVEHLPPMSRPELDAPFADALFAATAPGVLPSVVRTRFGVHVVVLDEIVPASTIPRSEWEPAIRRQLANERRLAALDALASALRARTSVEIDERAASIALSAPLGDEGAAAERAR